VIATADLTETVLYRSNPVAGLKILLAKVLMAATNDTVTFDELTKVVHAEAWFMSSGGTATCTYATNVVTLTNTVTTSFPIVVCAVGY